MLISKNEFMEAFKDCMTGQMTAKDFAKKAVAFMKSPDYNRWKAAGAAEDLRQWKEGRARLFELIEESKKANMAIDYEIIPLSDGHDSVRVLIGGGSLGFPSFFGKETVERHWGEFVAHLKREPGIPVTDAPQQG